MYICLCNALTDRKLKQAMAHNANATPSEVYAACGCRAQCGKCVRAILDMLAENRPDDTLALQGAD